MIELVLAGCLLTGADDASWPWSMYTDGGDSYWESDGVIRPDAESYYMEQVVDSAWVTIEYLGIEFGPIDGSDQIPSEFYNDTTDGPCPTTFGTEWYVTPEPPEPVTISFDTTSDLDEEGGLAVLVHNVTLGTATYDLGWPFGEVTVTLVDVEFQGAINMIATGTTACPGDVSGDGMVGADDILAVLSDWGDCSDDCSGDANGDGSVDVNDILVIISAFGPCP
ncbi:MAG: hypothetical protein MK101_05605 [Phycisphaerales bacterium]|nr:hypothetical protein [Phycisphaerales bacterium]